ncbi:MAG TPA: helix-turn-helix domain-containing protein [Acidimicrobiales bacterium]|nr:helix-turn-helix domain-containing protein [Acidimicrobiales bacterium]
METDETAELHQPGPLGWPRAAAAGAPAGRHGHAASALWKQNQHLRQAIALFDRLTAMALAGAGVAEVTEALATALGQGVVVFDPVLEPLASAGFGELARTGTGSPVEMAEAAADAGAGFPAWQLDDPRLREVFETAAVKRLPLRLPSLPGSPFAGEYVLAPIAAGDDVLGFLAVTSDHGAVGEELDLLNVQHAASIYALALLQAHRDAELRARYKRELVEGLLLGRPTRPKAAELAVLAGLVPDAAYWVIAIAPAPPISVGAGEREPAPEQSPLAVLARSLDDRDPGTVAVPRSDHVAVLVASLDPAGDDQPPATLARTGEELASFLGRRFPGQAFAIGASSRVPDPSGLGAAAEQAQRALSVALRMGVAGRVTTYDDLGIHRILLHVPQDELRTFAQDVLGPLLAYDREHRSSLAPTLATYLQANEHLRRTAGVMHLHVNTVSYRIRRIEAITGLALADPSQRLLAQVAVEALRVLSVD